MGTSGGRDAGGTQHQVRAEKADVAFRVVQANPDLLSDGLREYEDRSGRWSPSFQSPTVLTYN